MSEAYDAAVELRGALDGIQQELDYIGKQLDNSNLGDRRERIATAAMAAIIAKTPLHSETKPFPSAIDATSDQRREFMNLVASGAVKYADALIAALNATSGHE